MDFEQFIRHGLYIKNWSPKTVRSYRQAWASYGGAASPELTKTNLEEWVIGLHSKMSPGGIACYIRAINSYLSWLQDQGAIKDKPRLKLPRVPRKPVQGFSDSEIRSLLSFRPRNFFELRTFTLINLLLDCGCRIEEVLTLKSPDIDFDNLVLTVMGKGSKKRQIPFSIEARKQLFRYSNRQEKAVYFFGTSQGHRLSYRNTYRDIKNLCAKAGVSGEHVHPHAFRHHFAVTYIRRGGDIYRLSRILGHTSLTTTQLYLRSMGIEQIAEHHSSLSPLNQTSK
jgi:integrase/recombinase XerD